MPRAPRWLTLIMVVALVAAGCSVGAREPGPQAEGSSSADSTVGTTRLLDGPSAGADPGANVARQPTVVARPVRGVVEATRLADGNLWFSVRAEGQPRDLSGLYWMFVQGSCATWAAAPSLRRQPIAVLVRGYPPFSLVVSHPDPSRPFSLGAFIEGGGPNVYCQEFAQPPDSPAVTGTGQAAPASLTNACLLTSRTSRTSHATPNFTPPPEFGLSPASAGQFWYGSVVLWTLLDAVGVWSDLPRTADGKLVQKIQWWRGVQGDLTLTGRRLDAPAPPIESSVPSGYGDYGWQMSGVHIPTPGCWEITGQVAGNSLSFIVWVTA